VPILYCGPLLWIDEQILGSQVSSTTSPPASLKELERPNILQTLTLTDWHRTVAMEQSCA